MSTAGRGSEGLFAIFFLLAVTWTVDRSLGGVDAKQKFSQPRSMQASPPPTRPHRDRRAEGGGCPVSRASSRVRARESGGRVPSARVTVLQWCAWAQEDDPPRDPGGQPRGVFS